ncbi:Probable pectate lyase 13, partial [Linum perenne]
CQTGNPIDDCWRCDPNWPNNRQRLADCGIGFGRGALGGRGGQIYVVTDSSDHDPSAPTPGTLRYGVIQDVPLWIIFAADMTISLKHELIFNSYKTVDGRGAIVQITGNGCLTLQYINHVIIHNVRIYDCKPSTHVGFRGRSDGDGISLFGAQNVWIDHCTLSSCTDGLIDAIMGSTGITISNNYFSRHNEVMLMGHDDRYVLDRGMQVTIAFNRFGEELVQRMPRCRHGYIHVVNNDFTYWKMYAIGGSASPTINSQGNRYVAPVDPDAKEVTKRVETDEKEWAGWNWRTDGDIMVNGAFFVPSGAGVGATYEKATSLNAMSATLVEQLTSNAGVLGGSRNTGEMPSNPGFNGGGTGTTYTGSYGSPGSSSGGGSDGGGGDVFGMVFGSGAAPPTTTASSLVLSVAIILILYSCGTSLFFIPLCLVLL